MKYGRSKRYGGNVDEDDQNEGINQIKNEPFTENPTQLTRRRREPHWLTDVAREERQLPDPLRNLPVRPPPGPPADAEQFDAWRFGDMTGVDGFGEPITTNGQYVPPPTKVEEEYNGPLPLDMGGRKSKRSKKRNKKRRKSRRR